MLLRLFCWFALIISTSCSHKQTEPGKRREVLDSRYIVEWSVDSDLKMITFELAVETTSFVGFGISLGGTMNGADIFIGGVNSEGQSYFDVRLPL
jgi:hypothetical protein